MSIESFHLTSFPETVRRYHNDGAVFVSPFDGRRYCITSVDNAGCVATWLDAKGSIKIQFSEFEKVFNTVRAKGGAIDYHELFAASVQAITRSTYLQAPQLGLSHDKKTVTDLSDQSNALEHFRRLLQNLRVDKSSGVPKPFKPVIIACVIEGIESGELTENRILFDWILPKFLEKTKNIGTPATPEKASYPFYHLNRDLFWILCYKDPTDLISDSPSPKQLEEKVKFAFLKETYWKVLSDPNNRQRILEALAEKWWPRTTPPDGWAAKIADYLKNEMPPARLEARLKFESQAKELIENRLGQFSEAEAREFFRVVNTEEKPQGGPTKNRFAMAFLGHNVNLVTARLDLFNQWVKRLWTDSEDQLKETLDEFWRNPLPGMPLLPPLILYLRDPDKFSIWMEAPTKGLKKITGFLPGPNRDAETYFRFNSEVSRLREEHALQPQVMDALLSYFGRDIPEKLAPPLSNIFDDEDEATSAFDFLKDAIERLGATGSSDLRFALTFPDRSGRTLRLNFCSWLVLQFSRTQGGELKVGLALQKELALPQYEFLFNSEPFKQDQHAPDVCLYKFEASTIFNMDDELRSIYEKTFAYIAEKFKSWKATPYRSAHLNKIFEAIVNSAARAELFQGGFRPDPAYWIFQGNPNHFDAVGALKNSQLKTWSVHAHKNDIKNGDKFIIWIVGNKAGCYGLGTITSDVKLMKDYEGEVEFYRGGQANTEKDKCELTIDINLCEKPILKQEIEGNEVLKKLKIGLQGTNFSATKEEFEELFKIALEKIGNGNRNWPIQPVVPLEEISNKSGIEVAMLRRWVQAIERKGQAVIYGPPGTGKTFVAEHLAASLIGGGNGFCELVQFHPAYAYEDFIQGIRPGTTADSSLCYTLTPGRFLDFCTRARERSGKCVLIIDEINRANLARVFGELMYLLEYRNREIPLAAGEYLSIPENVRLIGTMNTADRSIALVDHALRRRFAFIALRPQYETLVKSHADTGFPIEKLVSILKKLNGVIGDPHYEIGISFFIRKDLAENIEDIWCMEIEPYIEEYFFDQPGKVDEFRWSKIGQEILS